MSLSASPRAALLPLSRRLPRRPPPPSPASPPLAPLLASRSDQGFGRLGAVFVARAKDADDGRGTATEKRVAAPPQRGELSHGEGFGVEASEVEEEQGESSSWNVLDQITGELDSDYAYNILIYGTSALVAFWIAAVIISALDSIPLVPKVMEVVGLGFTVWFTSRYLIFKDNRDELLTRIDSIKKQILGSGDEFWDHARRLNMTSISEKIHTVIGRTSEKLQVELAKVLEQEEIFWFQSFRKPSVDGYDLETATLVTSTALQLCCGQEEKAGYLCLRDGSGRVVSEPEELRYLAVNLCKKLSSGRSDPDVHTNYTMASYPIPDQWLFGFESMLSNEDIKAVDFSIGAYQSPALDWIQGIFYQKFWEKVQSSVFRWVK